MIEDTHVDTMVVEYRRRGPDTAITGRGQGSLFAVALTDLLSAHGFDVVATEVVADGALPRLYSDRVAARAGDRIVIDIPGVLSTDDLAKGYFGDEGMLAYVKGVQRREIRVEHHVQATHRVHAHADRIGFPTGRLGAFECHARRVADVDDRWRRR